MEKKCPICGRVCPEIENFCTKCGVKLEKASNRCSENKTTLCSHRTYEDDDIYCAYCGSLTTYALDRQKK